MKRWIEPALAGMAAEQHRQGEALATITAEQHRQGEAVAELRGRLNELSSKSPTIWQIVGAVPGINAGIMALGFALASLLRHVV